MLKNYIKHARDREYMGDIERDKARVKATAEVFTPTPLVLEMLDKLEAQEPSLFSDPTKTFLDNSCGDGQFLVEVVIRKMERGSTLEQALSTTYGFDIMEDNIARAKERLAGPKPSDTILAIIDANVLVADGLNPPKKELTPLF